MKEFGSDFHFVDNYFSQKDALNNIYKDATLFADGRQCIIALIQQYKWKRIWMPLYFCYEVIKSIKETGIQVVFYLDYPCFDDIKSIENISFEKGDVLFRINYFGLREFRSESHIPVPVIEDHTHDFLGDWALCSNASWCIASLRKSLPLAEGGMVWSPKGYRFEKMPVSTKENETLADKRWLSMFLKAKYLKGENLDKNEYREIQLFTEAIFSNLPLASIDKWSSDFLREFDINSWYSSKKKNWKILCENHMNQIIILRSENDFCNIFSFVMLAETGVERDRIKKELINNSIYPAILWDLPESSNNEVLDFSKRMLSIHCDGRYSDKNILEVSKRLKSILGND